MSAGYEATFVFTWIRETLLADPVIANLVGDRIYRSVADVNAAYPHIVMQAQSLRDVVWIGGRRVKVDGFFAVRATLDNLSTASLDEIMQHVDAGLDGQRHVMTAGGEILSSVRQWIQELPFVYGGKTYRQQLGLYAIEAQGTA